ncbi:DUF3986 family protein [Geobacillus stearothermophilus]|nr:DUF3986 family protein [Geobacillus stearothermophilus]
MKFDPNQHLHLGYYENNVDLEAVAYKIQNENKWVVFLDHEQDTTLVQKILNQYPESVIKTRSKLPRKLDQSTKYCTRGSSPNR